MKLFTTAIAAAALMTAADAKGFNGFYAGADIGMSNLNPNIKVKNRTSVSDSVNINGHALSPVFGIYTGYSKAFSNCLTGAFEVGGDFNFDRTKTFGRARGGKYTVQKSTFNWNLVAKLGYLLTPKSQIFAGVGVKSLKNNFKYIEDGATPSPFSVKNRGVRPTYQLGLENLIANDTVAVKLAYAFTQGSKKSKVIDANDSVFTGVVNVRTRADEHQVKLGISYRF